MDRKSVNIAIRSVLNSSPKPLTINEVWKDYINCCGTPVPLRELGFRSLHDYLRSIPDVVSLDDPDSPHSLVRAVTDEKSKHIAQFVKNQKVGKNTRFAPRRRIRNLRVQNDFVPLNLLRRILNMLTRYTDGLHIDDFREIVNDIQREMQLECQFDSVFRKISPYIVQDGDDICLSRQYLNNFAAQTSQNPPRIPNEVIIASESGTEDDEYDEFQSNPSDSEEYAYTSPVRSTDELRNAPKNQYTSSGEQANHAISSSLNRALISDTLIKNCYALLDENPQGFWLTDLEVKYENKFGYRLDTLQHGFDCVFDMVVQLKDVFNMLQYEKSGDRFLRDARKFPNDSTSVEQAELPKSTVLEIKKLLLKRSNHQLYTDELASEYKECYKKTLEPADFGFNNMDGLLKSLNDNESSVFSFKQVRQRTVMYLKVIPNEEQNYIEEIDSDGALPCNYDFNFLPREVCSYDFKLPSNPILHRLIPGQRISVKMAEVYGPEKFFLHFTDDINGLNSMMEDLHIFYENNSNTYELSYDTVRRGMLCACPFHQDSKWHRVQVMMCRNMSNVKVRYFDYGTMREVSVGKLRYLHSEFARLPALCVRTKLSGIKTKKFNESEKDEQKNYSRLVGESFFDLANDARELEAEIVSVDVLNQCMEVHLFAMYDGGKVISIHEKLVNDGLVFKEIDDVAEIPLPPSPKPKPTAKGVSSPLPSASTTENSSLNTGQKKKNRPPPGIPIPPNLNVTSSASTSTQTSSQNKTFNGYTQSKMNPMNPPFYPAGYSPQPQPNTASPMYGTPPHSIPMGPPLPPPPPPFIYQTVRPQPMYTTTPAYPPVSMYGPAYVPYSVPHPPHIYEYYSNPAAMRGPMPNTFANYTAVPQEVIKPPPGFNYKPAPAKAPSGVPSVAKATGIPLHKYSCTASSALSLHQGSCFEQTALNTCCCCGLDCSLNVLQSKKPCGSSTPQNKPEWISKLEVVRDLVLTKDMSPQSVTGKLKEIIGDINADVPRTKKVENPPSSTKRATTASATVVKDPLLNNLNGLSINDDRPRTPVIAVENGTVDLTDVSPITPARSECEFSVKSEGRESTRDELRMAKMEQLRLFVMLQNNNLKKT